MLGRPQSRPSSQHNSTKPNEEMRDFPWESDPQSRIIPGMRISLRSIRRSHGGETFAGPLLAVPCRLCRDRCNLTPRPPDFVQPSNSFSLSLLTQPALALKTFELRKGRVVAAIPSPYDNYIRFARIEGLRSSPSAESEQCNSMIDSHNPS